MDFLKNLAKRFAPQPRNDERYYNFNVKCKRGDEIISGRADFKFPSQSAACFA